MPTYDYECEACGHAFELFQSMTAAVKRKCPECGKPKLQRLIGRGAAVLFKGAGFYETDYRSSGYEKSKAAESSDTAKPDPKPEKKADSTTTPNKKSEPAPSPEKKKSAD